jgi:peptide/nickel transport system substrate-binding protein
MSTVLKACIRKIWRRLQGLTLVVAVVFGAVSITPLSALAVEPSKGGTLTIALEADFPGFDPLSMGSFVDRMVAMSFYEMLMELDEQGNVVPHLAKSLTASEGGTVYTMQLREGIKFHDGTPFNAEAVVFNFRRLMDPDRGCRCAAAVKPVESVTKTGPYTVEFHLKAPNAAFPGELADVPGMQPSPTAIRKAEEAGKTYGGSPVGTGPFRLASWQRGISMKVERNPDYWQDGLPHLDSVIYRPIPDEQSRMASLIAGDIQLSVVPAPQDVAATKAGQTNVNLVEAPGLGSSFAMFNAQRAPLNDSRVRQALFHAINRPLILKTVLRGIYSEAADSPFGPGMEAGRLDTDFPEYDPAKAKALLAEYGKPVKFVFSVSATPHSRLLAQVLQQMWKKVGVEVQIKEFEQLTLIRDSIRHDFDAMLYRWPGRADPDQNSYQFFHSKSLRNYTQYANPEMDELLEKGRQTLDPGTRLDIYEQVAALLAKDGPYLFLYPTTTFFLTSPKLHGLPPIPDGLPRVGYVWLEQ